MISILSLFWNISRISILRTKISEIGDWPSEAIKTGFKQYTTQIYLNENFSYSDLYLQLKYIFAFKKSSTFANLLMERPGNLFATIKMWKSTRKRKILRKESLSVPAWANQPPGFYVSGTSTPNN